MKIKFLLMCLLACSNAALGYHIFWDINEVLLGCDKVAMTYDLGPVKLMRYTAQGHKPTNLAKVAAKVLDTFGEQKPTKDRPLAISGGDVKSGGIPLSQLGIDCFCGTVKNSEVIATINDRIKKLDKKKFFSCEVEKELVITLVDLMYQPKNIVKYRKPIAAGVELLKQCCDNQAHTCYILSNWDPESFELVREAAHLESVFSHFDQKNIFLSCDLGTIKPYHDIFDLAAKKAGAQPAECILIDDSSDNVAAAKAKGWIGIHVPNKDFSKAKAKLEKLGIL